MPTLFLKWIIMRYWVEGKSGFAAIIEKLFKQIKSQSATISAPSIIEPLLAQSKCKPKFYFIIISQDFNISNTLNRKVTASWWNTIHIKWNAIHIKLPKLSSRCVLVRLHILRKIPLLKPLTEHRYIRIAWRGACKLHPMIALRPLLPLHSDIYDQRSLPPIACPWIMDTRALLPLCHSFPAS